MLYVLGCGGFGAVYLADDSRIPGRQVAVKENLGMTPQAQTQFRTEVNLTIDLEHPALPKVTDQFVGPYGRQYLVMDYIEGDTLEDTVRKSGPLAEQEVIAITKQLLNVLDYLHDHSVIHRDVKPANIKMKPDGKLILVDFGLAKIYVPGMRTQTGARGRGTPGFSSPEQYSSGTDARSDIYSLGAVMYYMLSGVPPPEAIALGAGIPLLPPRQKRPDLSSHIQSVVLKAMALNPTDRFQSVPEMRWALIAPTSARPSSPSPAVEADETVHSRPPVSPPADRTLVGAKRPVSQQFRRLYRKIPMPFLVIIVVGLGLFFLTLLMIIIGLIIMLATF
jgi:serine/threonine-protein kinase